MAQQIVEGCLQFVLARLRNLATSGRDRARQRLHMCLFMLGDLLETAAHPRIITGTGKLILRVLGKSLRVVCVLEMLQSEGEDEDINT